MKPGLLTIFYAALITGMILLAGCSDSDQYLYHEEDSTSLQIHAEMVLTSEIDSAHVRADTITSKDTLIFIGEIYPSRQAHYREYFWTMDGISYSNDMNFRKTNHKAGYHEICFTVVDYFGDTLQDTLHLWVSNPPVIDTALFIPARGAQGLSPNEGITFSWHSYDPDSIQDLQYHFIIKEPARFYNNIPTGSSTTDYVFTETIIDTILDKPHFNYHDNPYGSYKLRNLSFYSWEVRAINSFGLESDTTLQGNFFTKGADDEGGIQLFINTPLSNYSSLKTPITLSVLNSESKSILQKSISFDTSYAIIAPLAQGKYRLIANTPDISEFIPDTVDVYVRPGEISANVTLSINDTTPPICKYLSASKLESDTLDFKDTLKFYIEDYGGRANRNILFNGQRLDYQSLSYAYNKIPSGDYIGDTIFITLPENFKSWTYQLLTIEVSDYAKNLTSKTYVISPSLERPKQIADLIKTASSSSAGDTND